MNGAVLLRQKEKRQANVVYIRSGLVASAKNATELVDAFFIF